MGKHVTSSPYPKLPILDMNLTLLACSAFNALKGVATLQSMLTRF